MQKKQAAIIFIFITVMIDMLGVGIIIPVIPTLIMEISGKGVSEASLFGGLMMAVYSVVQFFSAPVLGGLSDKYGRRPVLLASLIGLGLDYIVIVFAPTLVWLFVARVISGLFGASMTVANAYIADISAEENRAKNFGLIGAAFGIGFIVGPLFGGILGEFGSRVPFMFAAGLSLLNSIYGFLIVPESLPPENRRKFEWKRANAFGTLKVLSKYRSIIGLAIGSLFLYLSHNAIHVTWSFFTTEKLNWSLKEIGLSISFIGVMLAIVLGKSVGPIVKVIGEKKSIYVGLALNATGLFLLSVVSKSWMVYAAIIPFAFGAISGPSLQSIMTSQIPKNAQGELQGGLASIMTLSSIIGPLIMASSFEFFTNPDHKIYFPGAPLIVGSILGFISIFIIGFSFKKNKLQ